VEHWEAVVSELRHIFQYAPSEARRRTIKWDSWGMSLIVARFGVWEFLGLLLPSSAAGNYPCAKSPCSAIIALYIQRWQGCVMADRKQFEYVGTPDPELIRLLQETSDKPVSEAELREQRISFAYGNSLNSELITKDSVREASQRIRLL